MAENNKHIVLGVTGSVAAYKSGDILRRLKDKGFKVTVVMTKAAEHFITPLTLSSLSRDEVYTDLFDTDVPAESMPHIDLARDADLVLVAPATANIIGKVANGLANDLLSCVIMATQAPVVFAPAMNTQMLKNNIVQENIAKLKANNIDFIDTTEGELACGEYGQGHLAEVDDIVDYIANKLK